MKQRNYFWGFVLVLMAICLIAGQYDVFDGVSFWMIILSILGGAVILDGIAHISVNGIVVGCTLLFVLWKKQLGFHELSNWTVLLAAVLLLIGLNILLHPFKMKIEAWKMRRKMKWYNKQLASGAKMNQKMGQGSYENGGFANNGQGNGRSENESHVWLKRNFSDGVEYIRSQNFQWGDVSLNFSDLKVYFENAVIQDTAAVLHVEINCASLKLFIPCEWELDNRIQHFAGETKVNMRPQNIAPTKTLRLEGSVHFGDIVVSYF